MKKFIEFLPYFFAFSLLLAVIIFPIIYYLTSGIQKTTEKFFLTLKDKNLKQARELLTEDLSEMIDDDMLESLRVKYHLDNFDSISLSQRSVKSGVGEASGSIELKNGRRWPITVTTVKEQDDWKIHFLEIHRPSLKTNEGHSNNEVALVENKQQIFQNAVSNFADAIAKKDMSSFRDSVSDVWKEQNSSEDLNNAYSTFFDMDIDWPNVGKLTPSIVKLTIVGDSKAELNGIVETDKRKFFIDQHLIIEDDQWKLMGFGISSKRKDDQR